jgi:hypothetical protein
MTLETRNTFGLLEIDIRRSHAGIDAVAGNAAPGDGGMNMVSGGMVGMAFQAIRVLIDLDRMCACQAQARAQQTDQRDAKCKPHGESHRSPPSTVLN